MNLNLNAKTDPEKRILEYLTQNASETLADKINNGKKTLQGCMKYMSDNARKFAKNGVACIDDATVFGWAIHYFEEDEIKEGEQQKVEVKKYDEKTTLKQYQQRVEAEKKKKEQEEAKNKAEKKQLDGQVSFFDWYQGIGG